MTALSLEIADEAQMLQLASLVAQHVSPPMVIYLAGPLGAGKTTFSRGLIQALGHQGSVKSPTYTLVEPYLLDALAVYHFDLYRLGQVEELEYMGIRDYFHPQSICLIEWPAKGEGLLPPADIIMQLAYLGERRQVSLLAQSEQGQQIVALLAKQWQ